MNTLRSILAGTSIFRWGLALLLAAAGQAASAAVTDIVTAPLFTSSSSYVKPNLMFILDDSGSMGWDYLPDDANFETSKYGKLTSQCNGVAYNPKITYSLKVDANGNALSAGSTASLPSADPNTRTTGQRTVTSPTSVSVPATVGTTLTLTVSNANNYFSTDDKVSIFSTSSTTLFVFGTVTNAGNSSLSVKVLSSTGSGTLGSTLKVGKDKPSYYQYNGAETPLSYTHTSLGVIASNFYNECDSKLGTSPGADVFAPVWVTNASADAQNYANWSKYYKTRLATMQTSLSRAFQPIGDRFRVGYSTISEKGAGDDGTNFLNVRDFDATQKDKFYTAMNAANPVYWTPLRGALSKAGRYFAKKVSGQTIDPMQYSCQKNFTILSTDGYWNTPGEHSDPIAGTGAINYGPWNLASNNVGELDGLNAYPTARPKYDGGSTTVTNKITWDETRTVVTVKGTTATTYQNAMTTTTGTYGAGTGSIAATYSGYGTISSITRCGSNDNPCVIGVTTTAAQGYKVGDLVTITGVSPNDYNGQHQITSIANSTFTYVAPTRPSRNPSGGNTLLSSPTCKATEGLVTRTGTQTDTYPLTLTKTTTANTTATTTYTVQEQVVTTTPWSQTQTVVNGAQTNLTAPQAGTPSSKTTTQTTPPNPTPTTATGVIVSGPTTSLGTSKTVTTPLAPTQVCVGTLSSPVAAPPIGPVPTYTPAPPVPAQNPAASSANYAAQIFDSGTIQGPKTTAQTGSSTSGGSSDSLADVAFYYYDTDLRTSTLTNCTGGPLSGPSTPGGDVCGSADKFLKQNMVSFTIGLGVNGTLKYDKNYTSQNTAGSGDFYDLKVGNKTWPVPTAVNNSSTIAPENIDDLWHAAVNATDFGTAAVPVTKPNVQYFSAADPSQLIDSLNSALTTISQITGSASAAATSTLQPVAGDNDVFLAKFTSAKWIGDLQRLSIDPDSGSISTAASWSAAAQLDSRDLVANPRTVYYFKPTSGNAGSLQTFTVAHLTADGLFGNFTNFCSKQGVGGGSAPQQCALITDKTAANDGSNLVAYLLGTENTNYRSRDSRLGDIINGAPLFVGPPRFKYTENDYATWAASTRQGTCSVSNPTKQGTVYVAANDGMLHAFDRCDGSEKWAYIPSMVIPNLYKLADDAYPNNHQSYVDGAPQMGDIYVNGTWKTILVGGLSAGGRGYYALDVTDPSNPQALWEFSNTTDNNLGLTFGNPVITKRADGTWVVAFSSGYNNVSGGDGNGHLFVVNAYTGANMLPSASIPTLLPGGAAAGNTTTPSGLSKINAWIDSEIDNTAKRFYGGDLLGNVWRFDIDSLVAPYGAAMQLAQLKVGTTPQPITARPELGEVDYLGAKYAVVYVATGKYLGTGDLSTTGTQTIYAIKDSLAATGLGDVRTSGNLVTQTLTKVGSGTGSISTATSNKVDWSTKNGWMVDLPTAGERVNVDMVLTFTVLSVASTIPSVNACEVGGTSWLYRLDIGSGSAVSNAVDNAAGVLLEEGKLIVGQSVVQLKDGSSQTIATLSSGELKGQQQEPPPLPGVLRRTSWRELAN